MHLTLPLRSSTHRSHCSTGSTWWQSLWGVQGRQWGVHVLEAPWAWLLAAVYIAATVTAGHPPVRAIFVVSMLHSAFLLCAHTPADVPVMRCDAGSSIRH